MSRRLVDEFYWSDIEGPKGKELTAAEKYNRLVTAGRQKPGDRIQRLRH